MLSDEVLEERGRFFERMHDCELKRETLELIDEIKALRLVAEAADNFLNKDIGKCGFREISEISNALEAWRKDEN